MSFIGDTYPIDVFISYSHGDPKGKGDSNFKQWSQCFWKELEREFEAHEDLADLRIFFDSSRRPEDGVDPFVGLDPQLEGKARGAAIFLPMLSPRYVKSPYCQRELAWWREAQSTARIDTRGRLAPVLIWGTPPEGHRSWPEALAAQGMGDLIGVPFFDRAHAETRPQPFGWPGAGGSISDPRFFEALLDVVGRLRKHLKDFRDEVRQRRAMEENAGGLAAGATPSIYLHGRSDAGKAWDRAFDALAGAGYPVFPDQPEPVETDTAKRKAIREQRVATMATCDAVLLVAPEDTATFSEELMVLGKADRGLAIDRAERELGQPGKRLPGAVVDTVSDPERRRRRALQARNTRLGWLALDDPGFVQLTAQWLREAP